VADEPPARGSVEIVEPSQLELATARRVAESKATVPHSHFETEVGLDAGRAPAEAALVRAAALGLRDFPKVNGAYRDGRFELYSRVNVGVALAARETLVFPTIFDADQKPEKEIAAEIEALAARARDATITQPELSGATFSIADLRPQGISRSSGVIRGGQAALLAAGATPAGLTLSLSCDGRILQGLDGPAFLARVRELLEAA
jgi:pyruvate dehydrogenase E2 component (dihydrolipoamide acetyltransferase)